MFREAARRDRDVIGSRRPTAMRYHRDKDARAGPSAALGSSVSQRNNETRARTLLLKS